MRCTRYKRVRVRGGGMQRRCAKFSGGRPRARGYRKSKSRKRANSYRRGHRPFNKGRKCVSTGVNKRGIVTCRSYGGKGGKRRGVSAGRGPTTMQAWMANLQRSKAEAAQARKSGGSSNSWWRS